MKKLLKKIVLCICIISLWQMNIFAQNEVDALRFSETDWQGSARFMGAGKAFGAVGAEFSAINLNPASVGLYKKNEVTFTPLTVSAYKNSSGYNGTATFGQALKYNLGSTGMVFAISGMENSLWKKFQIGFGYNRINNYNNVFSIEGRSNGNTIGAVFAEAAEGLDYREIDDPNIWSDEMWLAWDYWLISPKQGSYTSYYPTLSGGNLKQSSSVTRKGGNDEMIFSFGTNYDDKLFLGATIGVPVINFTENRTYNEVNDRADTAYNLQYFKITDKLNVRATGINLKLGVVYQPFDFLRVGAAFHTPTYYGNVKDYFERQIDARKWEYNEERNFKEYFNDRINYVNNFNYALSTPLRVMANAAFFILQRSFISAEYELADYSMANMYSVNYSFNGENKAVREKYGLSHIARIGAEFNVNQVFAVRAGYNYVSSPYKNNINDGSKHYASAGFGFRTKYFYGDFAYALTTTKEKYWMFDPLFVNEVNNKFLTHRIILTFGVKF